jgi:uncharacterized protein YndB with AHSA1/START domain
MPSRAPVHQPRRAADTSVAAIRASDGIVIAAPIEVVWAVLTGVDRYARWWPWPLRVVDARREEALVGSTYEINPVAAPGFVCRVETAAAPSRLRVRYVRGPFAGAGEWRLEPADHPAHTRARYAVDLTTTHLLLQPLNHVLSLSAVHSYVMGAVLAALARESERCAVP